MKAAYKVIISAIVQPQGITALLTCKAVPVTNAALCILCTQYCQLIPFF